MKFGAEPQSRPRFRRTASNYLLLMDSPGLRASLAELRLGIAEILAGQARAYAVQQQQQSSLDELHVLVKELCAHHGMRHSPSFGSALSTSSSVADIARATDKDAAISRELVAARSRPVTPAASRPFLGAAASGSSPLAKRSFEIASELRSFLLVDPTAELTQPTGDAAHAVALVRSGRALAKSVGNDDWPDLLSKLARATAEAPLRTSTSLLPPDGLGMRLYGNVTDHLTGLLFDEEALRLRDRSSDDGSNCFAWPSGYFAKSEYNITRDGELLHGRHEGQTTIAAIHALNDKLASHAAERSQQPSARSPQKPAPEAAPFNEIYAPVTAQAVIAVLARAPTAEAVLIALAASCRLAQLSRRQDALPVLLLASPQQRARCLSPLALAHVVRSFAQRLALGGAGGAGQTDRRREASLPISLPAEVRALLADDEVLACCGGYGCTEDGIAAAVSDAEQRARQTINCEPTGGAMPARAPVEQHVRAAAERALATAAAAALRAGNAASLSAVFGVAIDRMAAAGGGRPAEGAELERAFCAEARAEMLPPLGAFLALRSLLSGAAALRLSAVCLSASHWLQHSAPLSPHRVSGRTARAARQTAFAAAEVEEVRAVERSLLPLLHPPAGFSCRQGVRSAPQGRPRHVRPHAEATRTPPAHLRHGAPRAGTFARLGTPSLAEVIRARIATYLGDSTAHQRMCFYHDLPNLQRVHRPAPFLARLKQMVRCRAALPRCAGTRAPCARHAAPQAPPRPLNDGAPRLLRVAAGGRADRQVGLPARAAPLHPRP